MKINMNWKLTLFVFLAFILTFGLSFLQQYLCIDYKTISMPQLAPAFAYIITVIIFKDLFISINIRINKMIIIKAFFAVIIPLFMSFIIFIISKLFKMDTKIDTSWLPLVGILFGKFISATGEEIGWRGFFQPLLDKKYPKIISSVIVGIIWGLWHRNNYHFGLLFMCLFILTTISFSIIIEYLLKNTQYSIIISSLFHTSINIFAGVFDLVIMENYLIGIWLIMCIVWAIPAIIVVLCEREYFLKYSTEYK